MFKPVILCSKYLVSFSIAITSTVIECRAAQYSKPNRLIAFEQKYSIERYTRLDGRVQKVRLHIAEAKALIRITKNSNPLRIKCIRKEELILQDWFQNWLCHHIDRRRIMLSGLAFIQILAKVWPYDIDICSWKDVSHRRRAYISFAIQT